MSRYCQSNPGSRESDLCGHLQGALWTSRTSGLEKGFLCTPLLHSEMEESKLQERLSPASAPVHLPALEDASKIEARA